MAGEMYDNPNQEVVRSGSASPPESDSGEAPYDPGAFTVEEVRAYVEAHPEQAQAVHSAESAGKARTSLLAWLEAEPT